jgi:dolichyl-phosphate beta-glucosyltransferase
MRSIDVSVVIPAYNEEQRLPGTLRAWIAFFEGQALGWEVLVVDDGSRDETAAVTEEIAAGCANVRVLRQGRNRGKGAAVRAGVLAASGAHVFYVDADLNVSPDHLPRFVQALRSGADLAIGTRDVRRYAATERSVTRVLAGLLIQVLRRVLLLPTIRDTQCGFKGFTREAAQAVFSRTTVNRFAFDIEALFLARKLGYRIREIPVEIEFRPGSTYSLRRHLWPFVQDIVRIKRRDMRGLYGR